MISRVADHCFWVGRYLDRAESTARLLQVTRTLVARAPSSISKLTLTLTSGVWFAFFAALR